MRPSTYVAFFATSVTAQSTVTMMNFILFQTTLTQIGSDATATTYKHDCSIGQPGLLPSSLLAAASATITPRPKPKARLARQASSSEEFDEFDQGGEDESESEECEPYTLKEGPSTYEIHLTDSVPGAWTIDMSCNWKGAVRAAEVTCTAKEDGYIISASDRGVESITTYQKEELATYGAFLAYVIVTSSGTASASHTPSSGSGSAVAASASGTTAAASTSGTTAFQSGAFASRSAASGASASVSGSAASAPSSGFAAARPLPTGAMALVGSAAGIFAAALAL